MIRSSFAALGLSLFILGNVACGDKPPPKPPETTPSSGGDGGDTASSSGGTDTDGGTSETPPKTDTPPPAPAALAMPSAAAKLKFKSKKDFDIEFKSDGAVNNGGKPFAKVTGMELQDPAGKTQLKVDNDGNITNGDGAAYAKFEGDDLASLTSVKYNIADDGALSSTDEKGKKTAMGKSEGVGSAKKASLLVVAFAMWGTKAPAPPAAKKPGEKPAEKKPGEKPPTKK